MPSLINEVCDLSVTYQISAYMLSGRTVVGLSDRQLAFILTLTFQVERGASSLIPS
jgi:hypothetical protein